MFLSIGVHNIPTMRYNRPHDSKTAILYIIGANDTRARATAWKKMDSGGGKNWTVHFFTSSKLDFHLVKIRATLSLIIYNI